MFVLLWQEVTSVLLENDAMSLAKIFLGHFNIAEDEHSQNIKVQLLGDVASYP
jgi:hypothetical protein